MTSSANKLGNNNQVTGSSQNSTKFSSRFQKQLSVIVPAYNEEEGLEKFYQRLKKVISSLSLHAEIIFVNDGSTDSTAIVLNKLRISDRRIAIVELSRNFGKEIAMTAGLDHSKGEAAIIIDADLQDPPELIPEFIRYWQEGYDVVYGKRLARKGESIFKRVTAFAFYRLIQKVARIRIPEDAGDFRLLSRRAITALGKLREQHRFMKGLFTWIGYPQKAIPYQRDARAAGKTKWSYWGLWNFALEGITSFTITPLKIATYLGLVTAVASFIYGAWVIYKTLVWGDPVAGYPSMIVIILFLGGVQLLTIGVMGEYVGRIFDESKNRPLYLLQEFLPATSQVKKEASQRKGAK